MAVFANLIAFLSWLSLHSQPRTSLQKKFSQEKTECSLRVKSIVIGYRIVYCFWFNVTYRWLNQSFSLRSGYSTHGCFINFSHHFRVKTHKERHISTDSFTHKLRIVFKILVTALPSVGVPYVRQILLGVATSQSISHLCRCSPTNSSSVRCG